MVLSLTSKLQRSIARQLSSVKPSGVSSRRRGKGKHDAGVKTKEKGKDDDDDVDDEGEGEDEEEEDDGEHELQRRRKKLGDRILFDTPLTLDDMPYVSWGQRGGRGRRRRRRSGYDRGEGAALARLKRQLEEEAAAKEEVAAAAATAASAAATAKGRGEGEKMRDRKGKRGVDSKAPNAGSRWFNMQAPEMTPALQRDILAATGLRGAANPKRFYKASDGTPRVFQVGTVVAAATDIAGSLRRAEAGQGRRNRSRATNILEDIAGGRDSLHYTKRTFTSIQQEKGILAKAKAKARRGGGGGGGKRRRKKY